MLQEEGKDDLLEKVQEEFNDDGKPPLLSVEEALLREGGEEALRRALPVSYTHLDVYKRQPRRSPCPPR